MASGSLQNEGEHQRPADVASAGPASFEMLGAEGVQKIINRPDWVRGDNNRNGPVTFCRFRDLQAGVRPGGRSVISEGSDSSSMAMTVASRTTVGDQSNWSTSQSHRYPPSLTAFSSVSSWETKASISTGQASGILEGNMRLLPEDSSQFVEARACPFWFLNCSYVSDNFEQWETHCRCHFRGLLPNRLDCPFEVCRWSIEKATGEEAWSARCFHIINRHTPFDKIDTRRKPPGYLIDHLRRSKVIDGAGDQELRKFGRIIGATYLMGASTSEERRRRGRPGGGRSA